MGTTDGPDRAPESAMKKRTRPGSGGTQEVASLRGRSGSWSGYWGCQLPVDYWLQSSPSAVGSGPASG